MSEHEHADRAELHESTTSPLVIALAWALVGIPLAYGLWQTLIKAFQLLGG
jgi:hypothetical protein